MDTKTADYHWLTAQQAADLLGISKATLHQMWRDGEGSRHSQRGRSTWVRDNWFDDWLLAGEVAKPVTLPGTRRNKPSRPFA